ncbi:GINS complex subunit Sld5 protein [Dioscorea alata]|uniref:GINS complex subunit Sld5 protein n=1 Tax=Dioscorea alata TaxID=55571 RepID=A0ACB7VV45_DIOAL|nr:GINS complex subunit Sld5 protein [Dioscorea alata]
MASGSEPWRSELGEEDGSIAETTDAELLKRAWRNEKAAPEILQFQAALVLRAREQIQLLEGTVEEFVENGVDDLVVSLYQMDLDRSQFLLRSYLRLRLQKIEKYMIHISKTNLWNRLSEEEQRFAKSQCYHDCRMAINPFSSNPFQVKKMIWFQSLS